MIRELGKAASLPELLVSNVKPIRRSLSPRYNINIGDLKPLGYQVNENIMHYIIHFLDGSTQEIEVSTSATAKEACIALRDAIGLEHDGLFSLFAKGDFHAPWLIKDQKLLRVIVS